MLRPMKFLDVLSSTLSLFQPLPPTFKSIQSLYLPLQMSQKVLYELRDGNTYHIQLTAKNRHWCQYVFQFAHELGHIMCNFSKENQANLWFEESICEVASLYALSKIGNKWVKIHNDTNAKSYTKKFKKYGSIESKNLHIRKTFSLLAGGIKTGIFYPKILRKQNIWVALTLYDLFDQNPTIAWSTCFYLNNSPTHRKS